MIHYEPTDCCEERYLESLRSAKCSPLIRVLGVAEDEVAS